MQLIKWSVVTQRSFFGNKTDIGIKNPYFQLNEIVYLINNNNILKHNINNHKEDEKEKN